DRDGCALALSPRVRAVMPVTPLPPGGFPLPPLVAVDGRGCVVAAWAIDERGHALVPRGANEVELRVRARSGVLALLAADAPVRAATFVFGGIAIATAHAVRGFDDRGCPLSPPLFATGFGLVVGLGVTEDGDLLVIDAEPPAGARNVRIFRRDGSELE